MIRVNLSSTSGISQTEPITQWDFGRFMEITGLDIQKDVEVHFANHGEDTAIIMMGKYEDQKWTVEIPDISLTKGTDVFVFVYESSATAGRTTRKARIPITKRAKPVGYVKPETKDYLMHLLEETERTITESQKIVTSATIDRQRLEAALIRSTSSGTVFHETDCAAVPPINIKLFGKSTQNQYEGHQLFDEEWEVGFIDNNGQDVNDSKLYWKTKNYIDVPIGKPRFVAGIEEQISACYVFYYDENKQLLSQEKVYSRLSNLNNLSWNPSAKFIRFYVEMPAETNNVKAYFGNVMISYNENNTYEPYVGGNPSPSMEYPQKIERLGDGGSINGKVLTGNLFDGITKDSIFYWGTDPVYRRIEKYFTVGTYTMCFSNPIYLQKNDLNLSNSVYSQSITFNVTKDGIYFFQFRLEPKIEWDFNTLIWILNGEEALPYEQYTEQPFTFQTPNGLKGIPLGQTIPTEIQKSPIHLAGVYWDEKEGQYYIGDYKGYQSKQNVQVIGEGVLTGLEAWTQSSNWSNAEKDMITYQTAFTESFISCYSNRNEPVLSTHAIRNEDNAYKYGIVLCWDNKQVYFIVLKSGFPDVDTFKAHVKAQYDAGIPIKIYYILAEPIITDLTEEEIAQYDSLVMNYPNTTIVNDAGAFMKVTHVKDTQKHIEQNYVSKSDLEDIKSQMAEIQQVITNL